MSKNYKRAKRNTAFLCIFIGIILLLSAIVTEDNLPSIKETHWEILINLVLHLGIGAVVLGSLSILIDLDHWTEYFKQRLADIVSEKKYLENYSQEQLINLQTDVLKTYFKDDAIGGNDGFLKHYQNNIQEIIGTPFRLDVENDIAIKYKEGSDKKEIIIREVISWRCKSNRGKIQETIKWIPEEGEFVKVDVISVKLEHEAFKDINDKSEKIILFADFKEDWKKENGGFVIPLDEKDKLDGLKITLVVDITNTRERFYAWRMAQISKGLTITIRYPEDLVVVTEIYSIDDRCYSILNDQPGFYKWSSRVTVLRKHLQPVPM